MHPALTWSFEPLQTVPTVVVALLYWSRTRHLAQQGRPLPRWRRGVFWTGIALVVVALNSPVDRLGEHDFFFIHMTQHVILGDLAPLCFVAGMTGQLLRPVLALRPVERLRVLAHPLVALPVWAVDLCVWHIPVCFDGALHHEWLHAIQHACFFTFGAFLWAALLELLPGPRWFRIPHRLAYLGVMWLVSLALSQIFIWSPTAFYDYGSVGDQRLGGGIMLLEGSAVMLGVFVWLLWSFLVPSPDRGAAPVSG